MAPRGNQPASSPGARGHPRLARPAPPRLHDPAPRRGGRQNSDAGVAAVKLIGVGFGRTGTMSLKHAREGIGAGPCFHMIDLIQGENRDRALPYWIKLANGEEVDWHEVFEPWESTVDWPACTPWRALTTAFPDAPCLLNYRDFDGFYSSC